MGFFCLMIFCENEYFLGIGAGDLYIRAECNLLIQTCTIIDDIYYDASSSENISKYTLNNLNLSYRSSAYKLYQLTRSNQWGTAMTSLSLPKNVVISADVQLINAQNNLQCGFKFGEVYARIIYLTNSTNIKRITIIHDPNGSDITYMNVSSLTHNKWYKFILEINDNTMTLTLKDEETIVASITANVSSYINDNNVFGLISGVVGNSNVYNYFKNIEVKPL